MSKYRTRCANEIYYQLLLLLPVSKRHRLLSGSVEMRLMIVRGNIGKMHTKMELLASTANLEITCIVQCRKFSIADQAHKDSVQHLCRIVSKACVSRLLSLGIYKNVLLEEDWKCRTRQSTCIAEHAQSSRRMHSLQYLLGAETVIRTGCSTTLYV